MKKLVIVVGVLVVLIGAGWAGATMLFSNSTEPIVDDIVQDFNEETAELKVISGEKTGYEKGFLSSVATTDVKIGALESQDLKLLHKIYHGPIALTPDGPKLCQAYTVSTIDPAMFKDADLEEMKEIFDNKDALQIRSTLGLQGENVIELVMEKGSLDTDEIKVEFGGFSALMHILPDSDDVTGSFSIEPLTIEPKDEEGQLVTQASEGSFTFVKDGRSTAEFTIGGGSMNFDEGSFEIGESRGQLEYEKDQRTLLDLHLGSLNAKMEDITGETEIRWDGLDVLVDFAPIDAGSLIMVGKAEVRAPLFEVSSLGSLVSLKGLHAGIESGDEGGKLFGRAYHGVESIKLEGEMSDGPEFAGLSKLLEGGSSSEIGVRGIDRVTVEDLAKEIKALTEVLQEAGDDPDALAKIAESIEPDTVVSMVENSLNLIQPGFGFFYNTEMGEDITMGMAIGVKGEKKLLEMETVRDIVNSVEGTVDAKIGKPLLEDEMMQMMAMQYQEQGFLEEGPNGELILDGNLKNGVFKLAGESTELIEALGPMLDEPLNWDEFLTGVRSMAGLATGNFDEIPGLGASEDFEERANEGNDKSFNDF